MKIESKFNIGDKVFFMHNNKVEYRIIQHINFPRYSGRWYYEQYKSTPILKLNPCSEVSYGFFENDSNGDVSNVLKDMTQYSMPALIVKEPYIFFTKEELLKSL